MLNKISQIWLMMNKSSTSTITLTPTLITEMKPAEVLYQMREMRDIWREQDFRFTADQQAKYDDLKAQRRDRIQYFYDNDLVQKGPKVVKKVEAEQEEE